MNPVLSYDINTTTSTLMAPAPTDLDWMSFKSFISLYLIVNSFVPLDLIVIISLAKIIYTELMESDAWMMEPDYEMHDIKKAKCNTLNLHEEMG